MNNKEQIMIDDVDVSGCESIEHHSLNPITLANEFLSTPMCRAYQSKCEGRNCYFKQLARKTQELEQYKKSKQASYETMQREWNKATLENRKLKHECEELKKGYAELTDIVAPYMDDFTGYNEELGGFDIVLCVKQLMEQLDQLKRKEQECEEGEGNGN